MPVIADLHIHSRYSRATSAKLNPPCLERWARIKGIGLLGTGDCTHPKWLAELRENLADAEPGLFTLRPDRRAAFDAGPAVIGELPRPRKADGCEAEMPRFVLTGEISTIYKRGGKTRKIHHLVILPGFRAAAAFQTALERVGNISSDGRPILGLDSRVLLSMLLDADEKSMLIPAHIWTPWFSALGAKSGFDSIEECYGDLASHIPAIETGLSSDPPMNWALSSLDNFSIISNSDAHSPDKLGREATVFDMEFSYASLCNALRGGVRSTVEFFPEEGKYHYDGHRKCGVCLGVDEVAANEPAGEKICPVCGKPLTRGVMGRVLELADRPVAADGGGFEKESNRRPFHSLIPLKEILGELFNTGPASKKVDAAYSALIEKAGSELGLLMEMPIQEIGKIRAQGLSGELLAEAVGRMRRGEVSISPGFDGEYGVVRVFPPGEAASSFGSGTLFEEGGVTAPERRGPGCTVSAKKNKAITGKITKTGEVKKAAGQDTKRAFHFDPVQEEIISHEGSRTIVIAGPGTGKTAVLAARIAKLVNGGADGSSILALSFTVKAATELKERTGGLSGTGGVGITTATFHSFCCSVLREKTGEAYPAGFGILGEKEREELLRELCKQAAVKTGVSVKKLGNYIEERKRFLLLPGEQKPKAAAAVFDLLGDMITVPEPVRELEDLYGKYRAKLREKGMLDYEDLVAGTVRLFSTREDILDESRRRFRYIFVDEYQDINFSQYALLRLLADGGGTSLWIIGDPNQAIYGFRGGDRRFIDRFMIDYPNARRFELARSFRCAGPIISAAGRLTGQGLEGTNKPVELYRREYPTCKAEAEGIARAISRLIGGATFFAKDSEDDKDSGSGHDGGYADSAAPGDCAVLVRAAPLAAAVIKALGDHGIPFEWNGDKRWWEEEPFQTFLDTVRKSPVPEKEFQKEKENPSLKRVFDLAALLGDIPSLLDALAASDSEGIPEIKTGEGVKIATIHGSKGLEYDHVFVIGLEDGILPFTLYEEDPVRIEEERRLLYVAMTRARIGLYLSWARSRIFKGRKLESQPSPFLKELEKVIPLVESKGAGKKDAQMRLF